MATELTFGSWLKRRRRGLGFTQAELARQVGYAEVTLRKVEADELRPSHQMAQRLGSALQLESDELARFIRFARDEAGADDHHLPTLALPSLSSPAHLSLPTPFTSFVGRTNELARLRDLLVEESVRLVTITGPGGVGKTRLALEAASALGDRFRNGVIYVPLAGVTDSRFLSHSILASLNSPLRVQQSPDEQLLEVVAKLHALLLLDNYEQLLPDVGAVNAIMRAAPKLVLLITSRERLALQPEWLLPLKGLHYEVQPGQKSHSGDNRRDHTTAGSGQAVQSTHGEASEATQLFLQRANQLHQTLSVTAGEVQNIRRICRSVEGIPLAIELAAATLHARTLEEIAVELEIGRPTLTTSARDQPARHRSMQAAFEHSWDLLSFAEQALLSSLALFRGGFDREAAFSVAGATQEMLSTLIDKSLIRHEPNGRILLANL